MKLGPNRVRWNEWGISLGNEHQTSNLINREKERGPIRFETGPQLPFTVSLGNIIRNNSVNLGIVYIGIMI